MVRLWFGFLLFGVAFTVALVEALSRVIEKDRERRRHDEMSRVEREAKDAAATAWDNARGY